MIGWTDLQKFLCYQFRRYVPPAPADSARSRRDVTLSWEPPDGGFAFLQPSDLLYRIQKKEKIPPWSTVYCGSKTQKSIDNLAPGQAHVFRLQVLVKSTSVPHLATRAIQHYGSEQAVFKLFQYETAEEEYQIPDPSKFIKTDTQSKSHDFPQTVANIGSSNETDNDNSKVITRDKETKRILTGTEDDRQVNTQEKSEPVTSDASEDQANLRQTLEYETEQRSWLESRWSAACWCSTEPQGASVVCFCMAVRCGYIKQVQQMLDERPELVEIINSVNGLTPLITAINKGELSTVKLLLCAGADANQPAAAGHRPLHLALLAARLDIAALLLDRGAEISARDRNGLRAEHYAVDSGSVEVLAWVLAHGGQLDVRDGQGWTPLFRAVIQGASSALIFELLRLGADVTAVDCAGLALPDVARLLKDRLGGPRDSVVRLVEPSYAHERALDHFTRLTKKICSVQSVFK